VSSIVFSLASGSTVPVPDALKDNPLAGFLLAAGVLLFTIVFYRRVRMQRAKPTPSSTPPRDRLDQIRSQAASRHDLTSAMTEVEELTRRCAAHLDNKAARLEYLISLADERLARLEALTSEAHHAPPSAVRPPQPPAGAGMPHDAPAPPGSASGDELRLRNAVESAASPPRRAPDPLASPARDPLTQRVYDLADQGVSQLEIAQRLDEQIGKVELILALRAS
jgi:hypothetical protein